MADHDDHHQTPSFRPSSGAPTRGSNDGSGAGAGLPGDLDRRMVIPAPADDVWRALTDPEELAAWWGEGTTLKAGPGGSGRFVEDDEPTRLGTVVEVRPGQRLVFDWWPEDPDEDEPASRVTVDLEPCPFGTVVTITQRTLLDMSLLPVLVLPRPTFLPGEDQPGPRPRALACA